MELDYGKTAKNIKRKIKTEPSRVVFNIVAYSLITIISITCIIPFYLIIVGSFTSEVTILKYGFRFIPVQWSTDAYRVLFKSWDQIISAYRITIFLSVVGPIIGLFLQSMAGYVLQRKDFKYRNGLSFFIYFTTLFSGGLIPWYILIVQYLRWKDNILAMLVPSLISSWNIIMLKNFMKSIPDEITESAKIDGAGDFIIYLKLILPLSIPALATIGLFMALGYWNDWFLCNLFITSESKFNLQYLLYQILGKAEFLKSAAYTMISAPNYQPPTESLKLATAVVVVGPIIFLYPFIQKFFVKGLTVGAIKG
ncbi:MAG TPA: sugar ABC transporter permease [Clostridiaceae bacterium]|nr:sugar ABC transporter permease [Clostridiaceae bacterium]